MAQFLRPISNTANTTGGITGGFGDIDESSFSDTDYAYGTNNSNEVLEVNLTSAGIGDPQSSTGHTIRWRHAQADSDAGTPAPSSGGTATTHTVSLYQGTTLIATAASAVTTNEGSFLAASYTLSGAEADAITDYTNLILRFDLDGGGGSPANRRSGAISWAELEIPDAATAPLALAGAVTGTSTVAGDIRRNILDGLLRSYRFEENPATNGNLLVEDTGIQNGTNEGAATAVGRDGNAWELVGNGTAPDDWINLNEVLNGTTFTSGITVAIDFYPTTVGPSGTANIVGNFTQEAGTHCWHIGWNGSQNFRGRIENDSAGFSDVITTSGPHALNTWHRVIFRWQAGGPPTLNVNAETAEDSGVNQADMRTASNLGVQIGMDDSYSGANLRYLNGRVDNLMIWDRYLEDADVTRLTTGESYPTAIELGLSPTPTLPLAGAVSSSATVAGALSTDDRYFDNVAAISDGGTTTTLPTLGADGNDFSTNLVSIAAIADAPASLDGTASLEVTADGGVNNYGTFYIGATVGQMYLFKVWIKVNSTIPIRLAIYDAGVGFTDIDTNITSTTWQEFEFEYFANDYATGAYVRFNGTALATDQYYLKASATPIAKLPLAGAVTSTSTVAGTLTRNTASDPDALAFIEAVEGGGDSLTNAQETAIDNLVVKLKADGLWTKHDAIYPFVGGTATAHKWNLKDPQDLDASHRLTYSTEGTGSITHDANGMEIIATDGSNGAIASTHYGLTDVVSSNDGFIHFYSNKDVTTYANTRGRAIVACSLSGENFHLETPRQTTDDFARFYFENQVIVTDSILDDRGIGHYVGTTDGLDFKIYKNGDVRFTQAKTQPAFVSQSGNLFIGSLSTGGGDAVANALDTYHSSARYSFVGIGSADLTATDNANLYDAVGQFQNDLGRAYDPDAEKFIQAVESGGDTLTTAQKVAIDNLVAGLKTNSLWTSFDAIYPFIGGTATSHKWNLKNPLDTNAAYRLSYIVSGTGSFTHTANGMEIDSPSSGNGGAAWTYYTQDQYTTDGQNFDFTMAFYSPVTSQGVTRGGIQCGHTATVGSSGVSFVPWKDTWAGDYQVFFRMGTTGSNDFSTTWDENGDTLGCFILTNDNTTQHSAYENSNLINGSPFSSGTRQADHTNLRGFGIGGILNGNVANQNTLPSETLFVDGDMSTGTYSFASFGPVSLNATQAGNLTTVIESYQDELGRSALGTNLQLTGAVTSTSTIAGNITEIDSLTGAVNANTTVAGALDLQATLVGAVNSTTTVAGALDQTLPLAGAVNSTTTVAGTLDVTRSLAGAVSSAATVAGDLTISGTSLALSGSVSSTTTVAGALDVTRSLTGAVNASSTVAGNLDLSATLVGAITSTSTVAGDVVSLEGLAGSVSASSTVAGNLIETASLTGAITSASTLAGDIVEAGGLQGSVTGTSTVAGALDITLPLAGSVTSTTTVSGNLDAALSLAGAITSTAAVSGDLSTSEGLSGGVTATSTVAGEIVATEALNGAVSATSTVAGDIIIKKQLTGTITATSTVSGDILIALSLEGAISSVSSLVGDLVLIDTLQGAILAQSAVAGDIYSLVSLAGGVTAQSIIAGTLISENPYKDLGITITGTRRQAGTIIGNKRNFDLP